MKHKVLIYIGIITGITLICYWFSFTQLLKSETYFFFWRTNDIAHIEWYQFFLSPGGFAPGDTWLFRPFTYLIDALRQLWFGTNYVYWHIMGFALHLLASLALFRLLWKFKPSILAVLITLCFSVSSVSLGAVLYEDINGYQLFTAFMFTGIYYAYEYVQNGKRLNLLWVGLASFLSCFFYEVGIVFTVAILVYLFFTKRDKYLWVYSMIIPIYVVLYVWSGLSNSMAAIEGHTILNFTNLINGLNNMFTITIRWVCEIILPSAFYSIPLPQVKYQPVTTGDGFNPFILALNLVCLGMVVYGIISAKNKKNILLYILLSLSVVYIFIISIMRSSILGEGYITSTNFDTYVLLAWVMVIVYILIRNVPQKWVKYICVALLIFATINGIRVFKANYELSNLEIPAKQYLNQVDQFVVQHKSEQDFTFHIKTDETLKDQLTMSFMYKEKLTDFTVPQIVYYKYWSDNPKYNLDYVDGKLFIK
jgi:hypothetical protein